MSRFNEFEDEVMAKKVASIGTVNGCIGKCCSEFSLFGETQLDFIIEGIEGNEDSKFVADMLLPVKVVDDDAIDEEDEDTWPTYTCKHWNTETKLCGAYDERPILCRTYPDGEICNWDGCNYDPSKDDDPLTVPFKDEITLDNEE